MTLVAGSLGNAGVILVVWLIVALLAVAAAAWLLRRTWIRRKTTSGAVTLVTALFVGIAMLGALQTVLSIVSVFGAVGGASVEPSQKARIMAEGVAEALNCTALSLVVGVSGFIVVMVIGQFHKRRE